MPAKARLAQALAVDPGSIRIRRERSAAVLAYGRRALSNNEFDLALSIVRPEGGARAKALAGGILKAKTAAEHLRRRRSVVNAVLGFVVVALLLIGAYVARNRYEIMAGMRHPSIVATRVKKVMLWRLSAKYFPDAEEGLDFYHASEHLWALARDLWGEEESAREWVLPLLKGLKCRGGTSLLPVLEELLDVSEGEWEEESRSALRRETAYFQTHSSRLDYPRAKRQGFPLGSGAMESACSQLQGRFKRPGQFWAKQGERNLLALELARRNDDWNETWAIGA